MVKKKIINGLEYELYTHVSSELKANNFLFKLGKKGLIVEKVETPFSYDIYVHNPKKKKKRKQWIDIETSKPHRRKKHYREGTNVKTSKAFRIKTHKRRKRSTEEEIRRRGGTLKEIRAKK